MEVMGLISFFIQNGFQRLKAPLVFLRRADGDADPFRQLIAAHRTHNHTQLLQFHEHALAVADAHQDKIRLRWNEFQLQLAEGAGVKFETTRVDLARLLDVFGVVQRREGAGLRHRVDVERLADFFQRGNEVGMPDAVANPQTGEAVNLRERPH